jgi:hypothetical protein
MCKHFPTHIIGQDIIHLIDLYMAERGRSWKHVLIFSQMAHDGCLWKSVVLLHMLKPLHLNALVTTASFIVRLFL